MHSIELWVDRENGFQFLANDAYPNYTDKLKPEAGQTALWTYKGIYIFKDEQVGQWSSPVSIAVAG